MCLEPSEYNQYCLHINPMPEGPEVVIATQYLKTKVIGKTIESVKVISGKYQRLTLNGIEHFKRGRKYKIIDIETKGKFLWFELEDTKSHQNFYIANTFGMTGRWGFYKSGSARVRFKLCCEKKNKRYNLYFTDQRNFGNIDIYDNYEDLEKRINKLAPDILTGGLSDQDVLDLINTFNKKSKKDKTLYKILMDQNAIISGVGNYLSAEILYDAKLRPQRKLDKLSLVEKKRLAHSMRKIVKHSYYDNKTGYMQHYIQFMENHPVKVDKRIFPNYHPDIKIDTPFEFKVYGQDADPDGNKVESDDTIIKGRSIHWVPKVQK
jgi:formamidopyrimidine-DNA glycosylase